LIKFAYISFSGVRMDAKAVNKRDNPNGADKYFDIGIGHCLLDKQGYFISADDNCLRILNCSLNSISRQWFGNFFTQDSIKLFNENFFTRGIQPSPTQIDLEICKDGGTRQYVSLWGKPCYDSNAHLKEIHCSIQDISKIIKRSQEQILVANERLHYLLSSTRAVIYTAILSNPFTATFISNNVADVLGYDRNEYMSDPKFWVKHIHPEDLSDAMSQYELTLKTRTNCFVYRFRHKKGHYIWMRDETRLVTDSNGRMIEIVGYWSDVSEVETVRRKLEKSHEKLRNLYRHAQMAREEERRIVAREIHDELGQELTALRIDLAWVKDKIGDDNELIKIKLISTSERLQRTIQVVNWLSTKLRPMILDDLGLTAAMECEASEFQTRTGIICRVKSSASFPDLDKDTSINLFRIFQETLTNVARHSQATTVRASLRKIQSNILMEIQDNGIGITPGQANSSKSIGLLGMRERAEYCHGTLEINSIPNKSTKISVCIPLLNGRKNG
jgi:PAS domain S-box-containing protein